MAKHIRTSLTSPRNDLTAKFVRSQLRYDPKTGIVRWKVRRSQRTPVGSMAGTDDLGGYRSVSFTLPSRVKRYYLHRVIFLMMTGRWPKADVDHINGNRRDNRWNNLREATRSENNWNSAIRRYNTSGHKGVTRRRDGTWIAQIRIKYKPLFLGAWDTKKEAAAAYITAARIFHKEFFRKF